MNSTAKNLFMQKKQTETLFQVQTFSLLFDLYDL
jgi:hypothetical protein